MNQDAQITDEQEGGEEHRWGRMDFKIEVVSTDEATRQVIFRAIPDPRRYDRIEQDGAPHYLDKYLRMLIPENLIMGRGAHLLAGLPIYHLSPSLNSAPEYAAARKTALGAELQGGNYVPPVERAIPHQNALANSTPRELAFLSVDICGGSALRRSNSAKFDRAYGLFMRELATVVGQFNGTIYKATGDGFIAYIDHPSFTSRSDQAIDLGLSLLLLLRDSINPSLHEADLPELKIRVGADTGQVDFRKFDVPTTGFSETELASDALNRAVKIQESANPGTFLIGRNLYELIHVQWLERAEQIQFDGSIFGAPGYRVYRVT